MAAIRQVSAKIIDGLEQTANKMVGVAWADGDATGAGKRRLPAAVRLWLVYPGVSPGERTGRIKQD
ncbi:MAG: hypothetical protein HYX90_03365 [Chloroflexi bacterium]|nr:hypothetical protein [Chloroflexota bacterium]